MLISNNPNEPNVVENQIVASFIIALNGNWWIRVTIKNAISKPVGNNALTISPVLTALLSRLFVTFAKPILRFAAHTEINKPIAPPTSDGNS